MKDERPKSPRRGASALALAILLSVGLLSLGIAGVSLARTAERSFDRTHLLHATGSGRARPTVASPAEPAVETLAAELPAELREKPRDLASILSDGAAPLSGYALFADQALCVGGQARVEGTVGCNGDLWLRGGGAIAGDAFPGPSGELRSEGAASVRGHVTNSSAMRELPRAELPAAASAGDLFLSDGETRALSTGERRLGNLELGPGATLGLTGPAFIVVDRLELAPGARIVADGSAGAVELHVLGDFLLASRAELAPGSEEPDELRLHLAADTLRRGGAVIDLTSDSAGRAGRIVGRVYAPEALLVLDRDFVLRGSLVAGALRVEGRARVLAAGR